MKVAIIFFATLKLGPRLLIFYDILSCLVNFGNFKIRSHAPDSLSPLIFSLSHIITPYSLAMTSYHALSLLITHYHTLFPRLEGKPFSFGNFKISSHAPDSLSPLITPCHSLPHAIRTYPLGWK